MLPWANNSTPILCEVSQPELETHWKPCEASPPGTVKVVQMKRTCVLCWCLVPNFKLSHYAYEKTPKSETLVISAFWRKDTQIVYCMPRVSTFFFILLSLSCSFSQFFNFSSCFFSHSLPPTHLALLCPIYSSLLSSLLFSLNFLSLKRFKLFTPKFRVLTASGTLVY